MESYINIIPSRRVYSFCPVNACLPPPSTELFKKDLIFHGNNVLHRSALARITGDVNASHVFVGPKVKISGECAAITIENNVYIGEGTVIEAPKTRADSASLDEYVPQSIGSHVYIGERVCSRATSIRPFCIVESYAVLGERCVVGAGCWVKEGSVVEADQNIEPFTVLAGNPAEPIAVLEEEVHPLLVSQFITEKIHGIIDILK